MKRKLAFVYVLPLIIVFGVQAEDVVTKVANLGQMSYNQASSTVDDIVNQNNQLIATLTKEIKQPDFPRDSKTCSIYLLGQLRPSDLSAIQTLIENIDFVTSRREIVLRIGRWGTYPAQEALIKIGMPAAEVILRNYLPTENNQLRRQLMCGVLRDIFGKDIGIIVLTQRLNKEPEPSKHANLETALREFQK